MLRQIIFGSAVSLGNIAIHALVMVVIVWAGRSVHAKFLSRPTMRLVAVMIAAVSVLMAAHLSEIAIWSLAYALVGAERLSWLRLPRCSQPRAQWLPTLGHAKPFRTASHSTKARCYDPDDLESNSPRPLMSGPPAAQPRSDMGQTRPSGHRRDTSALLP